jgi:hypothetical protein
MSSVLLNAGHSKLEALQEFLVYQNRKKRFDEILIAYRNKPVAANQ